MTPQQNNQAPQFTPPGQQFQPPNPGSSAQQPVGNTIAVVGLVLAFIAPLIGLICSIIGLSKSKRLGGKNRGLAIAGIVVSIFVMIISNVFVAYVLLNADTEGSLDNDTTSSRVDTADDESSSDSPGQIVGNDDGSSDSQETGSSSQEDRDNETGGSADEGDSLQAPASEGDYVISNVSDLVPVCASNSFPSGIASTADGKKTVAFSQEEVGGDYIYQSLIASSLRSLDLAPPGYTTNEVDLVACLEVTREESFRVPCTLDDKSFELVGYEFDVTVYSLHSKEQIGSTKVNHSDKCPRSFAVIVDGEVQAANVDADSLASYVDSL